MQLDDQGNIIRKYETNEDWTYKRSDEELLDILDKLNKQIYETYHDPQNKEILPIVIFFLSITLSSFEYVIPFCF